MSDKEVEKFDLQNAVAPEEAYEMEEMTTEEMAVNGYNVVVGIARQEYKR